MNFTAPFRASLKCNRASIWTATLDRLPTNWLNIVLFSALCSACATKPIVDTNVTIDFPSNAPVTSVSQADAILEAVDLSRAQIDWRFRQKEQICLSSFFTNYCLAKVKEERRVDLARVKQSEVAANYFIRKNNVEEMDKTLIEKYGQPLPGAEKVEPSLTK